LGSARTGLYNYIYARRHGGTFILRIEDTDPSRSTDEAIGQILRSLREMGLDWDEGPEVPGLHGPYRQTERQHIYREHIARLLETGHAYRCFCTSDELEAERRAAQEEKRASLYSGRCRSLSAAETERLVASGRPYTLRMRVPPGETAFRDMLRDRVVVNNETIGDFIIQRSDGTVTYNLAVVVDDVTMEITHVIRGDDHISNTPKQILIYEALGAPVPRFLHMPLLFGTDKKKLSKRHGATTIEQLTAMGHLVEVVRNYLAFLSTEFDETMISWTLADLVDHVDVEKLGTSASIFDPEKLRWMNGRYIREMDVEDLGDRMVAYLTRVGFYGEPETASELAAQGPQVLSQALEGAQGSGLRPVAPDEHQELLTRAITPLVREKVELLADFIPLAGWFFRPLCLSEATRAQLVATSGAAKALAAATDGLRRLDSWDLPAIEGYVRDLPARVDVRSKDVFAALRLGMSGQRVTPGLFESLHVLGRDESVSRLRAAAAAAAAA